MISRRAALTRFATGTATLALATRLPAALAQGTAAPAPAPAPDGPFKLPPLGYAFDALEPHIDARTMEIHHDKHHAAYVANLNKAVAGQPELAGKSVEHLVQNLASAPDAIRAAVRNNAGGHLNHSLFWQMLKKGGGGEPSAELKKAIETKFGSFGAFKEQFSKTALGQFGSGWAWLAITPDRQLVLEGSPNQDSPLMRAQGMDPALARRYGLSPVPGGPIATPLLGVDVWEHAYYLKYQNRRADYLAAFWNVVNWDFVAERFAKATA